MKTYYSLTHESVKFHGLLRRSTVFVHKRDAPRIGFPWAAHAFSLHFVFLQPHLSLRWRWPRIRCSLSFKMWKNCPNVFNTSSRISSAQQIARYPLTKNLSSLSHLHPMGNCQGQRLILHTQWRFWRKRYPFDRINLSFSVASSLRCLTPCMGVQFLVLLIGRSIGVCWNSWTRMKLQFSLLSEISVSFSCLVNGKTYHATLHDTADICTT